jgi:hypothetical protein
MTRWVEALQVLADYNIVVLLLHCSGVLAAADAAAGLAAAVDL